MNRFAMIAISTLALAACSDSGDLSSPPQKNILIAGNVSECGVVDRTTCYEKLDMQLKILYDKNNGLSRKGESEYNLASSTNNELAMTYLDPAITQAAALRHMDKFIGDVTNGRADGRYSTCAADQLLNFANWIRGKIATANVDLSDSPGFTPACFVSPLTNFTGVGTTTGGVTLKANDPYHYSNGPYGDTTWTYFVVDRQTSTGWTNVVTTVPQTEGIPTGTVVRTFTDAATNVPGVYTYRVVQCDSKTVMYGAPCSTPALTTVTILDPNVPPPPPPPPTCTNHDNSNQDPATNNNREQDKCDKVPPGQAKKN